MRTAPKRALGLGVCLLVLASCLSCSIGPLGSSSTTYTAQFRQTLGLYEGNDVTVLGYPVGTITKIASRGTHMNVTFKVDDDVQIPADVQAVVLRPGIVTDRSLELTPAYRRGPTLAAGSTIPLADTRQPIEYDEILTSLDEFLEALSPADGRHVVRDATKAAAGLLGGNGRKVRDAIEGISAASEIARQGAPDVQALLRNLDIVTTAVVRHDQQIRRFSDNLAQATSMFADDSDTLTTALSTTVGTLRRVTAFVNQNRTLIRRNVTNATRTSETAAAHLRELREILVEFPLALENIGRATDPERKGLKAKVAYGATISDSGTLLQICQGSPVPFLCALTGLTGIPGNAEERR